MCKMEARENPTEALRYGKYRRCLRKTYEEYYWPKSHKHLFTSE